jgi:hypothetical protein
MLTALKTEKKYKWEKMSYHKRSNSELVKTQTVGLCEDFGIVLHLPVSRYLPHECGNRSYDSEIYNYNASVEVG